VKRLILFGLLGGLLATNTGCGLLQAVFCYRPCVARGNCMPDGIGDCGDACGPMNRPVHGMKRACITDDCGPTCGRPCRATRCQSCIDSCDSCNSCDPCADPCGSGCYGRPWHRGPLSCVFALFMPCTWCGGNCGERYWGDFYSDPPDCWDPCDCYGNYSGGSSSECSTCGGGNASGGCRNCGNPVGGGMTVDEGNVVSRSSRTGGSVSRTAYQPRRTVRP
jgi:hypothetical protein